MPRDASSVIVGWDIAEDKDGPIPELSPLMVPYLLALDVVGVDESGLPRWTDTDAFLTRMGAPDEEWEVYLLMWRAVAEERSKERRARMDKQSSDAGKSRGKGSGGGTFGSR